MARDARVEAVLEPGLSHSLLLVDDSVYCVHFVIGLDISFPISRKLSPAKIEFPPNQKLALSLGVQFIFSSLGTFFTFSH